MTINHTLNTVRLQMEPGPARDNLERAIEWLELRHPLVARDELPVAIPLSAEAVLLRPVDEFPFPLPARRAMQWLDVQTIGDLVRRTGRDLDRHLGCGPRNVAKVEEILLPLGLRLRKESK